MAETPNEHIPRSKRFGNWILSLEMTDQQSKFWDIALKSLGIIGGLIAFIWGIIVFKINSEREFKKEFYTEQIKSMGQTVDITSTLATYPDSALKFKQSKIDLEKLRAGQLKLFSDKGLEDLVGKFYADFNIYLTHDGAISQGDLKNESYAISEYCKQRIENLAKLTHD